MKHIKFPSIEQFRNVVSNINRQANYVGKDELDEPIYDESLPKPTLKFTGTVKLHGTNAAVCGNAVDGLWVQSRENIISPGKDNAGFAQFVAVNENFFVIMISEIATLHHIDTGNNTISIYGEWVGKGIQSGVAISNLDKSFFIFGIKVSPFDETIPAYWVSCNGFSFPENRIYNVYDYPTYEIEIDFNTPQLSQNKIIDMTIEVEDCCPVAKAFGFEGVGEGIVFTTEMPDGTRHMFKSKGEKHSKSKVKVLREVDEDKINSAMKVAVMVTPSWRLEQMLAETFDTLNGGKLSRTRLGDYLKAVMNDVIKEDLDLITHTGLEIKDIAKNVSDIAKQYFFEAEKNLTNV